MTDIHQIGQCEPGCCRPKKAVAKTTPEKHPLQPVVLDKHGVDRFKENRIVRELLDSHPHMDLNKIAVGGFSQEDQRQFAQLIRYSVSAGGSLSYADSEQVEIADKTVDDMLPVEAPSKNDNVIRVWVGNKSTSDDIAHWWWGDYEWIFCSAGTIRLGEQFCLNDFNNPPAPEAVETSSLEGLI